MGSDISIPEAVSRGEARELAEHIVQEKERQKEQEAAHVKEWEKHATRLERKKCAEYIDRFNTVMIANPGIQEVTLYVYKQHPNPLELACVSSAVEKKGFKIKSVQPTAYGTDIMITDKM